MKKSLISLCFLGAALLLPSCTNKSSAPSTGSSDNVEAALTSAPTYPIKNKSVVFLSKNDLGSISFKMIKPGIVDKNVGLNKDSEQNDFVPFEISGSDIIDP